MLLELKLAPPLKLGVIVYVPIGVPAAILQVAVAVAVTRSMLGSTGAADVVQITPPPESVTVKLTVPWSTWPTAGALTVSVARRTTDGAPKATDAASAVVVVSMSPTARSAVPLLAAKLVEPL